MPLRNTKNRNKYLADLKRTLKYLGGVNWNSLAQFWVGFSPTANQ